MDTKENLILSIDNLKIEIQGLIDKKIHKEEKQTKMKILEEQIAKLKKINKEEREQTKIDKQLKQVTRQVETIEFYGARKTKTHEAMQKVKRDKESREKARVEYSDYVKYETEYKKYDSQDYPGYLFLDEKVITEYGLCPYIKLNIKYENSDILITDDITKLRHEWLNSTKDKGEMYLKLKEKIHDKIEEFDSLKQMSNEETNIRNYIKKTLNENEFETWEEWSKFANEYSECNIKTKRIKEKYKILINKLSILYAETGIALHNFLSVYYNSNFLVNDVITKENGMNINMKLYTKDTFDKMIIDYKEAKEKYEKTSRYINNIRRNLNNELYLYLSGKSNYKQHEIKLQQEGKYFKRWILLTELERLERFDAFVEYYVEKHMIQENILAKEDKIKTVESLKTLLKDALKSKYLIYRDFKWNIERGIIETVKILRYNKHTKEFYINKPKIEEKPKREKAKRISTKTIFTKSNEKTINDEMLMCIVNNKTKINMDQCIEKIKEKLKIKKISTLDKKLIEEKYKEMELIIHQE